MRVQLHSFTVAVSLMLSSLLGAKDNGSLLFYLSGNDIKADAAAGVPEPNFAERVSIVPDGARGKAVRAHYRNAYAYLAPGNIFADRGTIAFFWRSGEEMTETEFPLWRVSFADHSSWDMVWLRIDWNGHGYDAFVTDNNLARVRVSASAPKPGVNEWIHLAFSWDESKGVKLYLNGRKVAAKDSCVCLNTGLDQFGPHQRIVSPYQVQSAYIVQRGGDIDEVQIYDRQLSDSQVAEIARGGKPAIAKDSSFDAEGWKRYYGFDRATPPSIEGDYVSVRKVEIADAYDYKRWYWKACDGLRETTWPGVYNRSRIVGRNDYFQLPDWDCYSFSGSNTSFVIPEPWNHIELTGGAFGKLEAPGFSADKEEGTQRSFYRTEGVQPACSLSFTNLVQETPIQEFNAFLVGDTPAPGGLYRLKYCLKDFEDYNNPALVGISDYIDGRFREGARGKLLADTFEGESPRLKPAMGKSPVAHIIIPSDCKDLDVFAPPVLAEVEAEASEFGANSTWNTKKGKACWDRLHAGLDGILLELPALPRAAAGNSGLCSMNIAVMDPLDPIRYMLDFSFSVRPGEAKTLWLDLRDRILPQGKPIYIRISGADEGFSTACLEGAVVSLIFKDYDSALAEHIADRFNQVRDNYGTLVEEATASRRYLKFRRFENDLNDLLRVDPLHALGNRYKYFYYPESAIIGYSEPVAPRRIPEWAYLQLKVIERYKYLAQWYLDNRQAPNGEFGGGLSDDSTFSQLYVPLAEMGVMADRSVDAVKRSLQAIYDNGMLTGGVSTIQSDGLHSYEEGEITIVQAATVDPGDSLVAARLLESSRGVRNTYMGVNGKGHLHLKGDYFGASKVALGGRWAWNTKRGNFHLAIPLIAAERLGDSFSKEYALEFFNSLFAHAVADPSQGCLVPSEINYNTDEARIYQKFYPQMMAYLWKWTGDKKYLDAAEFDSAYGYVPSEDLIEKYREILREADRNEWYNTHGSPYIDRVKSSFATIAPERLGGTCYLLPWNLFAWRFKREADAEKLAINVNYSLRDDEFEVEFFNTRRWAVKATMLGRRAAAGKWELKAGRKTRTVEFGPGQELELRIPARRSYRIRMKLQD